MSADYYRGDGDYSERSQHGPWIVSRDPETRARLFKRTMRQVKDLYVPMTPAASNHIDITIGTQASVTAYFYEETQPRDTGAGIIEFDEFYAEVPQPFTEPTTTAYTYQWLRSYWDGLASRQGIYELSKSAKAITVNTFGMVDYDGTTTLASNIAPRYIDNPFGGTGVLTVGNFAYHSSPTADDILANDSKPTRWHGPIFRRSEVFVEPLSLDEATS